MIDPLDLPEDEGLELVFPFVACQSNGGPYDDDAFTAGYQCGLIDRSLAAAAAVGATCLTFTVYASLVKQVELIGMARGFPQVYDHEDVRIPEGAELPEWAHVTFSVEGEHQPGPQCWRHVEEGPS